jgi:hypothetical protein
MAGARSAMAGTPVLESELLFLLQDEFVPVTVQQQILAGGYFTFKRFAIMGDDRPAVRLLLENTLGIADPLHRTMLVACWEAAKDRFTARSKIAAEAEQTGLPRHRLKGDVKS